MPSIRTIFWGVNAALLALVAYSAAVLAAVVVEGVLLDNTLPPPPKPGPGSRQTASQPRPFASFQAVLNTNMFRAARAPSGAPQPATAQESGPVEATAPPSDKFPIPITVTGTVVMGRASVAFMADGSGKKENVFRLQDCFPQNGELPSQVCGAGQAQLTKIASDSVQLQMNQRSYTVKIGAGDDTPPPAVAATPPSRPSRSRRRPAVVKGTPPKGALFPSERKEGGYEFRLPAAEVEKAFENFSDIVNDARVVPFMVEGKPDGFQIKRIRPGSIFQQIGLQDDDILKNVNGESLTTADQALRLFTLFRNEREINLEIKRGGQDVNMSYLVE